VTASRRLGGVTLIELLIALALGMILILLAVPAYNTWVSETEEQTAAASLADGLRFATAEAIKRNQNVEFAVTAAGWTATVDVWGVPTVLRDNRSAEGSYRATRTPTPAGRTLVTFNSLGGVEGANADLTLPFDAVSISVPNSGRAFGLRVVVPTIGSSSGIKVCDPNPALVYPTDPKACP
jgi:type IV fimbrial biogenesis protein FimT